MGAVPGRSTQSLAVIQMNTGTKAITVLAILASVLVAARFAGVGGVSEAPMSLSGLVVSVDNSTHPDRPGMRQAVVKLETGESVRALVPAACVVFPGQIARLARFDHTVLSSPGYMVLEAKEKNDS
jgi:hypothetical protein